MLDISKKITRTRLKFFTMSTVRKASFETFDRYVYFSCVVDLTFVDDATH